MAYNGEFMKKLNRFEWAVLTVTAAFALFAAGYFTAQRQPADAWRVQTERNDSAESMADEAGSTPNSLLEGEMININTAAQADLERLPGIGEVRARAIVAYREENGPFLTLDDLLRVSGIGSGILEGLRPYATIS